MLAENSAKQAKDHTVHTVELKPGMILAQDLLHADGYVILPHDRVLDAEAIQQLMAIEKAEGCSFLLSVRSKLPPSVPRGRGIEPQRRSWKNVALTTDKLQSGMVLARDLYNRDGYHLLAVGFRLTQSVIKQLLNHEANTEELLSVHIRMGKW